MTVIMTMTRVQHGDIIVAIRLFQFLIKCVCDIQLQVLNFIRHRPIHKTLCLCLLHISQKNGCKQ